MDSKIVQILLVEDDSGDVELTREALSEERLKINLTVASDGVQAMEILYSRKPPDLVLLDLNLPRKDGREVLAEMKLHQHLRSIPVVVFTTSEADEDILKSYGLGANCYVTKPLGLERFMDAIQSIENFWFTVVQLPPR